MRRVIVQLALVSLVAGSSARAQALSHDLATRVIQGCVDHAKQKRQGHAIAVFDAGAQPLAFLRMDGNASGIGAFAMEKAAAVAHWRFATSEMANAATATPGFARAPHVVTVPGGVPIWAADGRTFIGAVGVSGEAPADDVACAEAGIRAAGLKTARGG